MSDNKLSEAVQAFIDVIERLPLKERREQYGVTYMLNTYLDMKKALREDK